MRYAAGVSLTLLRKGRGQDGDLLFLQLLDFIPQLDNSLPNCPDLGRVTERAERDMGYSRPRCSSGPPTPSRIQAKTPSPYLLEELLVRAPQPCRARVHHQRDSLLVLFVRAVIPLPGPESLAPLFRCGCHPAGPTGFRDFPSWPSATPPYPEDQESCVPVRPRAPIPAALASHLPQLVGPVPHGGLSSPSPASDREAGKLGIPVPHSHSDTPLPPPVDPNTPTSHQSLRPLHRPQSMGRRRPRGPPKVPQVGIPFSSPLQLPQPQPRPSVINSGHAHMVASLPRPRRGRWNRKLLRPERKRSCVDARTGYRHRNRCIFQRKSGCQKG